MAMKLEERRARNRVSAAKWYSLESNRELQKQRVLVARKKNRDYVSRVKLFVGCKNCGYKENPVALDFHHREAGLKPIRVSDLVAKGCSTRRIKEEIRKCDVLCANCHRIHHNNYLQELNLSAIIQGNDDAKD